MNSSIKPFVLVAILLAGCAAFDENGASGSNEVTDLLVNHWGIDRSESSDEVDVFFAVDRRPVRTDRFPMQYVFRSDGTCDWLYLHPADAHHFKTGTWRVDSDTLRVQQDREVAYQIVEVGRDVLRLRRLR